MTKRVLSVTFAATGNKYREAFDPDGNKIVGVNLDHRLKIWPEGIEEDEFDITINGVDLTFKRPNSSHKLFQCRPGEEAYLKATLSSAAMPAPAEPEKARPTIRLSMQFVDLGNGRRTHGSYSRTNFAFSRHGELCAADDNDGRIDIWPRDMERVNEFEMELNGYALTFQRAGEGGYLFQCRPGQDKYRKVVGLEEDDRCPMCGQKKPS